MAKKKKKQKTTSSVLSSQIEEVDFKKLTDDKLTDDKLDEVNGASNPYNTLPFKLVSTT